MNEATNPDQINLDQKTCLFINRRSAYGSGHAQEALDMAYALSAFEHKVSLVFLGDAILQLHRDQQPAALGIKNFSPAFAAWQDYEIQQIYVDQAALSARALKPSDLLIEVELIDDHELARLIQQHTFIFND